MADAAGAWKAELDQKLKRVSADWRDEIQDADWREGILENEDTEAAGWIRVYCIYETSSPVDQNIILGNCGVPDPTLYIPGGVVDLEYHSEMTFTMLWNQFMETVLTRIKSEKFDDDEQASALFSSMWKAMSTDSSKGSLLWCEVNDEDCTDLSKIKKPVPGLVEDMKNAARLFQHNLSSAELATRSLVSEDPLVDLFSWPDDDEEKELAGSKKALALIRTDHGLIASRGLAIIELKKTVTKSIPSDELNGIQNEVADTYGVDPKDVTVEVEMNFNLEQALSNNAHKIPAVYQMTGSIAIDVTGDVSEEALEEAFEDKIAALLGILKSNVRVNITNGVAYYAITSDTVESAQHIQDTLAEPTSATTLGTNIGVSFPVDVSSVNVDEGITAKVVVTVVTTGASNNLESSAKTLEQTFEDQGYNAEAVGTSKKCVYPIYRAKKAQQIPKDWINLILQPTGEAGKGLWEAKLVSKAGDIVADKKKGSKGKRGTI